MEIIKHLKINGVDAQLDYENVIVNKPSIPSKTSEIENDSKFITANDIPEPDLSNYYNKEETIDVIDRKIADIEIPTPEDVDLSEYAKKSELPTKISQLENDSGFLTANELNAAANNFVTKAEFGEASVEINSAFTQVYGTMSNFVTEAQVLALINSTIITALNSEV